MCDILGSYKSTLVMLTDVSEKGKHAAPELVAQISLVSVDMPYTGT